MKTIRSPWRLEFILGAKEKGCVFCNRIRRRHDREDLIIHRGRHCFVILNKYPYNPGHLMVVPKRHVADFDKLRPAEANGMTSLTQRAVRAMKKGFRAEGLNIGANLGKAAGAGIDDHLHMHVIPRWGADTNFWPVIAETKSMPQHLLATYDHLKKFW